ncbi:hypothetical protein V865_002247 [Kwoniella europaea PYCC6329]|uniref:Uncharacterized protein n=1 Tax=Kwoniella europaea PYCC6329 TaxID=1423913 RepID=A0AAX4KF44_9TREE
MFVTETNDLGVEVTHHDTDLKSYKISSPANSTPAPAPPLHLRLNLDTTLLPESRVSRFFQTLPDVNAPYNVTIDANTLQAEYQYAIERDPELSNVNFTSAILNSDIKLDISSPSTRFSQGKIRGSAITSDVPFFQVVRSIKFADLVKNKGPLIRHNIFSKMKSMILHVQPSSDTQWAGESSNGFHMTPTNKKHTTPYICIYKSLENWNPIHYISQSRDETEVVNISLLDTTAHDEMDLEVVDALLGEGFGGSQVASDSRLRFDTY